jgi:hypothetical protein
MKRASKLALIFSGCIVLIGIIIGIIPLLEPVVSRVMTRATLNPAARATEKMAIQGAMMGGGDFPLNGFSPAIAPMSSGRSGVSSASTTLTKTDTPTRNTPRFLVRDLSELPGANDFVPTAMNDKGTIVGNYRKIEPTAFVTREIDGRRVPSRLAIASRPAIFRENQFQILPSLPGHGWTAATDINNADVIVGASRPMNDMIFRFQPNEQLPEPHILRWDAGKLTDLSVNFSTQSKWGGDVQQTRFQPTVGDKVLVTDNGDVFAGFQSLYHLRTGKVTRYPAGYVREVNNNGVMVGMVPLLNSTPPSTESVMQSMPLMAPSGGHPETQPGIINTNSGETIGFGRYSDESCAINDSGTVVLRGFRAGGVTKYSILKGGKLNPLATVPPSRTCLINNNGWVLMGDGVYEATEEPQLISPLLGPFLWTGKGYYYLRSLIVGSEKWLPSFAIAMNSRNQILILGYSVAEMRAEGRKAKPHILLLTPVTSAKGKR